MLLKYKIKGLIKHSKDLPESLLYRNKYENVTKNLETFCMFIGYPRSGHSIIGAFIDAHPNAIISHEQDALDYIEKGYSEKQIFYLLIKNSIDFAERGRGWSGYSYKVEGQWQGKVDSPLVIGDNMGGGTTERLYRNPSLIDKLPKKTYLNLKLIHVIRNPFDNIATRARRGNLVKRDVNYKMLSQEIDKHFREVRTVEKLKEAWPEKVIDIFHENFVRNPKEQLVNICQFLNLEASENYLERCAERVTKSTHLSRNKVEWSEDLIDKVLEEIEKTSFLKGYRFYS